MAMQNRGESAAAALTFIGCPSVVVCISNVALLHMCTDDKIS